MEPAESLQVTSGLAQGLLPEMAPVWLPGPSSLSLGTSPTSRRPVGLCSPSRVPLVLLADGCSPCWACECCQTAASQWICGCAVLSPIPDDGLIRSPATRLKPGKQFYSLKRPHIVIPDLSAVLLGLNDAVRSPIFSSETSQAVAGTLHLC